MINAVTTGGHCRCRSVYIMEKYALLLCCREDDDDE